MSTLTEHPLFLFLNNTILKLDEFSKASEEYFVLIRKIYDLAYAKRQKSITKQVLILGREGSEKKLRSLYNATYKKLNRLLEDIHTSYKDIETVLQKKEMKCQRCDGDGYIYKMEYYREKGQPIQKIRRSQICSECNGKGIIFLTFDSNQEYLIKQFVIMGGILYNLSNSFLKSLNKLVNTIR